MISETQKTQLIERWVQETGYSVASERIEKLARILIAFNPIFKNFDFTQLKVMDIGCGGTMDPTIESEHKFQTLSLWEPWFLRIIWLLGAQVIDGLDVVPQHQEDRNNQIYDHSVANIYSGYSTGIPLEELLGIQPESYNLINCTNVLDLSKTSPYLENLLINLGLYDQKDTILLRLIAYIMEFALYSLEENGILAIDNDILVKRDGELIKIAEQ